MCIMSHGEFLSGTPFLLVSTLSKLIIIKSLSSRFFNRIVIFFNLSSPSLLHPCKLQGKKIIFKSGSAAAGDKTAGGGGQVGNGKEESLKEVVFSHVREHGWDLGERKVIMGFLEIIGVLIRKTISE